MIMRMKSMRMQVKMMMKIMTLLKLNITKTMMTSSTVINMKAYSIKIIMKMMMKTMMMIMRTIMTSIQMMNTTI